MNTVWNNMAAESIPLFDALSGERVLLRPYTEEDAPTLYQDIVASRQHIARWLDWADTHTCVDDTRALLLRWQAQWRAREDMPLGVWLRATGEHLGGIALHPRDWSIPFFEIGYWLAAHAEGHGYMSEAVGALTAYAFGTLDARRVEIRCDARNERSAAVARRFGFAQEGLLRKHMLAADGTLRNTLIFALTDDDWALHHEPSASSQHGAER